MSEKAGVAIVILAAGLSARLGTPKQCLIYRDSSLIIRTLRAAYSSGVGEVYVLTGAVRDQILSHLDQEKNAQWTEIYNPDFQRGIGSSIKTALSWLRRHRPNCEGLILSVCDQIHLTAAIFRDLAHGSELSACKYHEGWGVPAYIPAAYFDELAQLEDDKGAKELLKSHASRLRYVEFELGYIDIDTKEDVERHRLVPMA